MDDDALTRSIEAAFPVTCGDATLSCVGIEREGERASLCFRSSLMENGELVGMMEQLLPVAALEASEGRELAARAAERLAHASIEGMPLTPSQLLAPPFRPLHVDELAGADGYAVYDRLAAQAHAGGFDARFDRLDRWPLEARTLYFLVAAHAILGGKGFEDYLSQAPLEEVIGVLRALEEGGCERLARRLREGLTLCDEDGSAELLMQTPDGWIESEGLPPPDGEGRAWSRIDSWDEGGTWWLVREELGPALDRYLEDHRAALAR